MKMQVTAANRKDSAAARPTRAARPGPENAIARAGDAPATDRPIASQMCSSRRRWTGRDSVLTAMVIASRNCGSSEDGDRVDGGSGAAREHERRHGEQEVGPALGAAGDGQVLEVQAVQQRDAE